MGLVVAVQAVNVYARQFCAPHLCSLPRGLHVWCGSDGWWEVTYGPGGRCDAYQGMSLTCMRGRGPYAPHDPLVLPPRPQRADTIERARRYVDRMPPALQGSGGSSQTFKAAVALVRGFALHADDALAILVQDYNPRCQPEWSLWELKHKIRQAVQRSRQPYGFLVERRASGSG